MSVIAVISGIVAGFGAQSFIYGLVVAASVKYQQRKVERAQKRLQQAVDDAKGFSLTTENEVTNVPVFYGRNRVGGNRVYHAVRSSYIYAGPGAGGVELLSSGDASEENTVNNQVGIGNAVLTMWYFRRDNGGKESSPSDAGWVSTAQTRSIRDGHRTQAALPKTFELGTGGTLTRTGPDSNEYSLTIPGGIPASLFQQNFTTYPKFNAKGNPPPTFFVGATIRISHVPFILYDAWTAQESNQALANSPAVFTYRITNWDPNTKIMLLAADIVRPVGTGVPSLNVNQTGKKNEFLFIAQDIGYGGINRIFSAFINEKDHRHPDYDKSARMHAYADGGTADPMLNANSGVSNITFPESAWASMVFKLNRDDPQYQGIPQVEFLIEGRKVRYVTAGYALSVGRIYSNNPAWCLLDYLLNDTYGYGLTTDQIDLGSFYRAAQVYGVVVKANVEKKGALWKIKGGTRNLYRYECNLGIDTQANVRDNVQKILETIPNATFIWSDGKYKLIDRYPLEWVAGSYSIGDIVQHDTGIDIDLWRCTAATSDEPSDASANWERGPDEQLVAAYVTDDDIVLDSDISIAWPPTSQRYNFCEVAFLNESDDFKEWTAAWPPKTGGVYTTYLSEDNGIKLEVNKDAPGITTFFHAQAYAEEVVRKSRHENILKLTLDRKYLYLEPGDIIHLSSVELGVPYELYEIDELEITENNNLQIVAKRYDARILAFNAPDNEVVVPRNVYIGPIPQVTGLTFIAPSEATQLSTAGTLIWDPVPLNNLQYYDVYYYPFNKESIAIDIEWVYAGSTTEERFVLPALKFLEADHRYTATVVPRTVGGKIAPREHWALGSFWPLVEFTPVPTPSLQNLSVKLQLFVYAKTDRVGEVIPNGGTYDFVEAVVTPPVGYYPSSAEALVNSGDVNDPGDLYFTESTVLLPAPDTIESNISWNPLELFAPERNIITYTVYHRRLAGGAVPATPTGGSYSFTNKTAVPPTGNVTWVTEENLSNDVGVVYESSATFSRMGNYGNNTNPPSWSTPRLRSQSGALRTTLRLYQWSNAAPVFIAGAETIYDWLDGAHGGAVNLGDWTLTLGTNPGGAGSKLWIAERVIESESSASAITVDWDDGNTSIYTTDAGSVPGGKSKTVDIYHWAASPPLSPVQNSTYNWASDTLSNIPNSPQVWYENPPASPTPGFTLWKIEVRLQEEQSVSDTTVYWSNYSAKAVGYAGEPGSDGQAGEAGSGVSARRAYGVRSTLETIPPGAADVVSGDNLPSTPVWNYPWTWSYNANFTLVPGEAIYQSDGFYDPVADQTTWEQPYLSSFKVGNLSAISATTGELTVNDNLIMGSGGTFKSADGGWRANLPGFYFDDTPRAFIGDYDDNNYFEWDGVNITIRTPDFDLINGNALFKGDIGVNSSTFGQEGIQLQNNGGNPRAYFGDGDKQFIKFENNEVSLGPATIVESVDQVNTAMPNIVIDNCQNANGWSVGSNSQIVPKAAVTEFTNNFRRQTCGTNYGNHRYDYYRKWATPAFNSGDITAGQLPLYWAGVNKKFFCRLVLARTNNELYHRIVIGMGYIAMGPSSTWNSYANGVAFEITPSRNTSSQIRGAVYRQTNDVSVGAWQGYYTAFQSGLFANDGKYLTNIELFIEYTPTLVNFYVNNKLLGSITLTSANRPNDSAVHWETNNIFAAIGQHNISGANPSTTYIEPPLTVSIFKIGTYIENTATPLW